MMDRFLWGVAVGIVGLLLVTLAIPGPPRPCESSPTLSVLAGERDAAREEVRQLRERLELMQGPFERAGLPVGDDQKRRAEMRRPAVDVPEAERIPPPEAPFPTP